MRPIIAPKSGTCRTKPEDNQGFGLDGDIKPR